MKLVFKYDVKKKKRKKMALRYYHNISFLDIEPIYLFLYAKINYLYLKEKDLKASFFREACCFFFCCFVFIYFFQ